MSNARPSPDRRAFIRLLGAIATGGLAAAPSARAAPRFAASPYRMGVASGSPSADGFVLWTRLFGPELAPADDVPVGWEVLDADKPGVVLAQGVATALAALGHSVHVEVAGLAPDRWYLYRFKVGGMPSTEGRTRTLPAAGASVQSLRLAYASCQRWEEGHYAAYRQMVADAPDLVMFLGDYIYERVPQRPGPSVRSHALPEARTLQDYRDRYAVYRSDPDLQAMHAAAPWLLTWDDHEVENDYAGTLSVEEQKDNTARRHQAYQAYYENMPLKAAAMIGGLKGLQRGAGLKLYGSIDYGKLARIYLLDSRQHRSKPLCDEEAPSPACEGTDSGSRTMLGLDQERWLADSLAEAARAGLAWNLIGQQTRFSTVKYRQGRGRIAVGSWDGYPEARQRLIDALARSRAQSPVIVGGDIHAHWVANVHLDPLDVRSPVVAAEFTGTSISSHSQRSPQRDLQQQRANPHCLLCDSQHRGYGLLDITPRSLLATLKRVDDPAQPDSPVSRLASYSVRQGDPTIRPA